VFGCARDHQIKLSGKDKEKVTAGLGSAKSPAQGECNLKKAFIVLGAVSVLAVGGCVKPIVRGPEVSHYLDDPTPYRLVEVMSGKETEERFTIVLKALQAAKITYSLDPFDYFIPGPYGGKSFKGTNIIADFGSKSKTLLIATHFDRRARTPGANDNASCVAAAISALEKLIKTQPLGNIKVRFLFPDMEEMGLIGSEGYVKNHGVGDIIGMASFEMCGIGGAFGIWDIQDDLESSLIVKALQAAGEKEGIYNGTIGVIPRNSSDHRVFYREGIPSVGVTIIPESDEKLLREYIMDPNAFKWLSVKNRPRVFQTYHTDKDLPETLDPKALDIASQIIYRTVIEIDRLSGGS
jgi:hypothetical protein